MTHEIFETCISQRAVEFVAFLSKHLFMHVLLLWFSAIGVAGGGAGSKPYLYMLKYWLKLIKKNNICVVFQSVSSHSD